MAWKRHTRKMTKEVFYDGTTIDGSRLDSSLEEMQERFNDIPLGDLANRFVAVQYHSGFSPQPYTATNTHRFPWLEIRNQADAVDITGEIPDSAPYNQLRFKGTHVPGIELNAGSAARDGKQWGWTRVFSFKRPVIIHAMSLMMHVDGGGTAARPYKGEDTTVAGADAYEFGNSPPVGFAAGDFTSDVIFTMDVFNPTTPEDATMTDVPYTRKRWVVNREVFTTFERNATATDWYDMFPEFSSGVGSVADARPLAGRLMEDRELNIPIPAGSKVRMAVIIPQYNQSTVTASWGAVPWYLQAMSATMTVLEEIQGR